MHKSRFYPLLPPILHNPEPCGKATGRRTQFGRSTSGRLLPKGRKNADGLLGDAHDAADVAVFKAHLVENEEEGVVGGLGLIFLLDAVVGAEVDGLVVVDEAFVVVV